MLSEYADVHYGLLLQRAKSKDTTRMLVSTIISLAKERKRVEKLQSNRFHGNRRGFTGYVIVSTLEGVVESIYRYAKGNREYYSGGKINSATVNLVDGTNGFYFITRGGGGSDGGYGYSEYGMCRGCGKNRLLYQPDWFCQDCIEGTYTTCNRCWENPCVCDTRQCQCVGGCGCRCTGTCTNCNGAQNPFECPKCGEEECDGNCDENGKPEHGEDVCATCKMNPCVCTPPSPRCQCAGDCDCNCTNDCTDCNDNQTPVDPPTGEVCENCGLNPCECS